MSQKKRIKWITLDVFGTLFKYDTVLKEASEKIIDREHLEVSPQDFYQKWLEKSRAQEWDKQSYKKLSEWFLESLEETFAFFNHKGHVEKGVNINLSLIHQVKPYPDVESFLDAAHGPYKICLLTNIDNQELHKVLFNNKLQFDAIVTSEMAEAYKPNKKIFETALSFIDTPFEETFHIGDSFYHDVVGAKEAGIQAIWLNREGKEPSLEGVQPDQTFSSLNECANFLIKNK